MREIDCRGIACPTPVIRTKQALEEMKEVFLETPYLRAKGVPY